MKGSTALALVVAAPVLLVAVSTPVKAEIFGGVDFPDGASSFADAVLQWDAQFSGCVDEIITAENADPANALGIPEFPDIADPDNDVSLGTGGLLELVFTDNVLTNSGDAGPDLQIFEVGGAETVAVAIRPTAATEPLLDPSGDSNSDGFWEVGNSSGVDDVDIDAFFPDFPPEALRFDAVQLLDDGGSCGSGVGTWGGDIDAVGAISSDPGSPVPTTGWPFLVGIALLLILLGRLALRGRLSV